MNIFLITSKFDIIVIFTVNFIGQSCIYSLLMHAKWSFPLRISSVNATKTAVSCFQIWSHLLKKFLMENFIFWVVLLNIFTDRMSLLTLINPLIADVPILYPLKTPHKFWLSGVNRRCKTGTLIMNGLNN